MAEGAVIKCNSKNEWDSRIFESATSGKLVVVDFTASWCGPCKMIAPLFAKLSEKFTNIVFLKVDVDELADVAMEWEVRAMPTFIFIKDGKQVEKVVGANYKELTEKVELFAAI